MKVCTKCHVKKTNHSFRKNCAMSLGREDECIVCKPARPRKPVNIDDEVMMRKAQEIHDSFTVSTALANWGRA